MRARTESAREVSTIGTRAPSTMPAASALVRKVRFLASMLPASRSGTTRICARPATSDVMPLILAASGSAALSKASGPSSTPPVICPRSAILQSAAASMVEGTLAVTVSTAERIATCGVPSPTCTNRSMAFCTMSRLASRSGKMLMAASVMKSVSAWVGTSMTNTWLIRRAVRRPVLLEATSRMSSSVCRLPFINSSPLDSCTSATALAAAASLCGASTISKRSMSMPCSRATAEILLAGPTRMGTMMPASAASTGPRREVSSQGCATIVVAGGTCFALAMSRSYFECGGLPNGLLAAIAPLSLSVSMKRSPLPHATAPLRTRFSRCLRQKRDIRPRRRHRLDAEQLGDLVQSPLVLGGEVTARAKHEADEAEHLAPGLGIAREHPRDCGKRGLLVDQQHGELLAHQRLEDRQRDVAVRAAKAAHGLEAAFRSEERRVGQE